MFQLCDVISFLHSKKCLHRDIKPNNILINSDSMVCLTDFGFARISDPKITVYVYVKQYRSPEIIFLEKYDEQSDVWALGWIFY